MVIVVEGQLAVGKTTFMNAAPAEQVVGEEVVYRPWPLTSGTGRSP